MRGLDENWTFEASSPSLSMRLSRAYATLLKKRAFPTWSVVTPPVAGPRWIAYFLFSTDGAISPAHDFTLARIANEGARVLTVATGLNAGELERLSQTVDAVVVKGREGYDFSAYAIAMAVLARHSPGADVLFLNDSVLGPFSSLGDLLWDCPWELTGVLASPENENHVQSFAFSIKGCTERRRRDLAPLFALDHAFDDFGDVVRLRETRMARVAARSMRVGARWYSSGDFAINAPMRRPLDLVEVGFPFLKRANFGKHAHLHDPRKLDDFLRSRDHPPFRAP